MNPKIVLSLRIYGWLLALYSSEFRKSYGGEMLWVFERQLTDAWSSAGAWGMLRVWWLAGCDLARVALPSHLQNERLLAFVISAPVTTALLGFLIRMLQDRAFAMWISHRLLFGCY